MKTRFCIITCVFLSMIYSAAGLSANVKDDIIRQIKFSVVLPKSASKKVLSNQQEVRYVYSYERKEVTEVNKYYGNLEIWVQYDKVEGESGQEKIVGYKSKKLLEIPNAFSRQGESKLKEPNYIYQLHSKHRNIKFFLKYEQVDAKYPGWKKKGNSELHSDPPERLVFDDFHCGVR
jgi:hypothetical protein